MLVAAGGVGWVALIVVVLIIVLVLYMFRR